MLNSLYIRNFLLVDETTLDFTTGMSVFSGETGVGKSITVDALGLTLGDRANSALVRVGCKQADITASFDISTQHNAENWLKQQDILAEGGDSTCILRRTIHTDGKSKAYINGIPVTAKMLRQLAELLVDIHGQHAHQSLIKLPMQLQLLDNYAGKNHQKLVREVTELFQQLQNTQQQLEQLQHNLKEKSDRVDLLQFQLSELDTLSLREGEVAELVKEHERLANGEQLLNKINSSLEQLSNMDNSAIELISSSESGLNELTALDDNLSSITQSLSTARIEIEEATSELQHYLDKVELSPERLQQLDSRLGAIHDLARKHQVKPEELTNLHSQLQKEFDSLEQSDQDISKLEQQYQQLTAEFSKHANKLTKSRVKFAKQLEKKITTLMVELGMEHGKFAINLTKLELKNANKNGLDDLEFLVSTNPGHAPDSLSKVASGGELSRISLAIQVASSGANKIPTLIFDEVDSGVGGRIAEVVGHKLHDLAKSGSQVITITHLPQVAACGDQHFLVTKESNGDNTTSKVTAVSKQLRVEEIARMLGGIKMTKQTLAHAQEMLDKKL